MKGGAGEGGSGTQRGEGPFPYLPAVMGPEERAGLAATKHEWLAHEQMHASVSRSGFPHTCQAPFSGLRLYFAHIFIKESTLHGLLEQI